MFSWSTKINRSTSCLEPVETEALIRTLANLLEDKLGNPSKGNLLILGQRWRGQVSYIAQCIMKNGASQYSHNGQVCSTGDAVTMAARQGMSPPSSQSVATDEFFGTWPKTGIYSNAGLSALVVNCDHGRFVASCFANFPTDQPDATVATLLAVAQTLHNLRPQDHRLRISCKELVNSHPKTSDQPISLSAVKWVDQQFYNRSTDAELKAWREWRDKRDQISESPSYFCGTNTITATFENCLNDPA